MPASAGMGGVGKSGSPAPRSTTSSPAALRRLASAEMAIVAEVSRCCRLGERPSVMSGWLRCLVLLHKLASAAKSCPLTIEVRVKVERSRHMVLVSPPPLERREKVWELVDRNAIVVCADHEQAPHWAEFAPAEYRAHAVTGLTRTAALLKEGRIGLLAGSPADLAALVARSALKLDTLETLVIAWPEGFAGELDALLAEAPNARRIVLSWNPPGLADFLERHARRAEVVGDLPLDVDGKPLGPVGSARFAVISASRRRAALRDALDALRATKMYVWAGGEIVAPKNTDVVIATTLPTREELLALIAIAPQPVVLVLASQLPYLRSIAALTPLPLPSAGDRAQDPSTTLRAQITERLSADLDAELAALAPLFEEHDPAMVAAALLALSRQPSAANIQPREAEAGPRGGGGAWPEVLPP